MRPKILLTFVVVGLILPLHPISAQTEQSDDAKARAECRLAAQAIRTGHPAPHIQWAYSVIGRCEDVGAAVLAEKWSGPPLTDTLETRSLAGATRLFPLRRVFDAVSGAALSRSNGLHQRVVAMALLASFAKPGIYLDHRDLMNPTPGRRVARITFSGDQESSQMGELKGVAPEVRAVMQRIEAEAAEPAIRRIAHEYVRFLTH